jgi:glutamate racemase
MSEIMKLLPTEDIVYFGDTARVPYGSKSPESVTSFSLEIAGFLKTKGVKLIVIACNTASAFALSALNKKCNLPVIGVIMPGAREAVASSAKLRIGVIGTEGTIRSSSYSKAINTLDKRAKIFSRACPLFVPLVEEGWVKHKVTSAIAKEYLKDIVSKDIDTLVLGCTHYPLIRDVIKSIAGPSIKLIDSASATAKEVVSVLDELSLRKPASKAGKYSFFVSDSPEKFQVLGQKFLKKSIPRVGRVSF